MSKEIDNYLDLSSWFSTKKRILFVCGTSARANLSLMNCISAYKDKCVFFGDFTPNPSYDSLVKGVDLFRREGCDSIIAVGGGSCIDVAKCIKLFSGHSGNGKDGKWINEKHTVNAVPLLVMPTTAGSGSEATSFAVIYLNGEKISIQDDGIIPDAVFFDPSVLTSLSLYQKKATICDALCHSIESYWSVNSTDQSKQLAGKAMVLIRDNIDLYLSGEEECLSDIMKASNLAGKAINISKTTAGHAMSYKITSLFGCAHGHATLMCNRILFPWMIENTDLCIDPRGKKYLEQVFDDISDILWGTDAKSSKTKLSDFFYSLELDVPFATDEQFIELKNTVNVERLGNNPIKLEDDVILSLYHEILNERE